MRARGPRGRGWLAGAGARPGGWLVEAGEEPGPSTGLEGRPGGLPGPGAQATRGKAWPGHPRIQSLTHRTQQGVGVTGVYPEQTRPSQGGTRPLLRGSGMAVCLRKGVRDRPPRHTCPRSSCVHLEGRFIWVFQEDWGNLSCRPRLNCSGWCWGVVGVGVGQSYPLSPGQERGSRAGGRLNILKICFY